MTDDLAALSVRFMEAVRDRQLDWLDTHLGDEFTLTTGRAGSPVRTRSEWLRITRELYEITEFEFASMGGEDRTQSFLMTDVWVEGDSEPQLVTRHISPLGETSP